jgi:pimeloyl-ACP methyl ester carboxylesterase
MDNPISFDHVRPTRALGDARGLGSGQPASPPALRAGKGEPLVLLHGVVGGAAMWRRVVPLLADRHEVFAFNALGHRGGTPCSVRPARIAHVVDDTERSLDALGLGRVHLAGNSMGGWVALELARRGRARSVCALSPAGMWAGTNQESATSLLRETARLTRLTRPLLPLVAGLRALRRFALRANAVHASEVSRGDLVELADILLGCTVAEDLFKTDESFSALPAGCPVTIAWSARDQIFPADQFEARARSLVPHAHYMRLENVGHVPMFDDARMVAKTIRESTARAK